MTLAGFDVRAALLQRVTTCRNLKQNFPVVLQDIEQLPEIYVFHLEPANTICSDCSGAWISRLFLQVLCEGRERLGFVTERTLSDTGSSLELCCVEVEYSLPLVASTAAMALPICSDEQRSGARSSSLHVFFIPRSC